MNVSRRGLLRGAGAGVVLIGSTEMLAGCAPAAAPGAAVRTGLRRVRRAGRRPQGHARAAEGLPLHRRHARGRHDARLRGAHPAQPRRHRRVRPSRWWRRARQQPRDPRAVRHRAARPAPRRPDLRSRRRGWLHGDQHRRGGQPARRDRRRRRHRHQLRGRRLAVGHLAHLRGDRRARRQGRLPEGPRLRLRGRSVRRGRQPRPAADQGARPVRARGRRHRPAARAHLPDRGRVQAQRHALPLDPARRLHRRQGRAAQARPGRRRARR